MTNIVLSLLTGLTILGLGWGADFRNTLRMPWYAMDEDHPWFSGEDGHLNVWKAVWVSALIYIGGAVGFGFLAAGFKGEGAFGGQQTDAIGFYLAACWLAGGGIMHYLIPYRDNVATAKGNREEQIRFRRELQGNLDEWLFWLGLKINKTRDGRWFAVWLPWITVEAATPDEARQLLKAPLTEWAFIPEHELEKIWGDITYHPKASAADVSKTP